MGARWGLMMISEVYGEGEVHWVRLTIFWLPFNFFFNTYCFSNLQINILQFVMLFVSYIRVQSNFTNKI